MCAWVVAELISLGCWDHLPQVSNVHDGGGASFPKCRRQLSHAGVIRSTVLGPASAMVTFRPKFLLLTLSWSMVLLHLGSLLMSVACVITGTHVNHVLNHVSNHVLK